MMLKIECQPQAQMCKPSGNRPHVLTFVCFSVIQLQAQVECPDSRRRSKDMCLVMHVPPPELFWDEPKQPDAGQDVGTPGFAPEPAWAVRSPFSYFVCRLCGVSSLTICNGRPQLRNLSQATAMPYGANRLAFRLQTAIDISLGPPQAI